MAGKKPAINLEPLNLALQIRNLRPKFSYEDRNEMFYGLGATTVHNQPYYSIAFFENELACHKVIRLLHQRLLNHRRLKVEFARPEQIRRLPPHIICDDFLKSKIKEDQCEAFRDKIKDLKTDSNIQIPKANSLIVDCIAQNLLNNEQFYHQVVLLMKQNGLNLPFNNKTDNFLVSIPLPSNSDLNNDDDDESELETELNLNDLNQNQAPRFVLENRKRKRKILKTGFVGDNLESFSYEKSKIPKLDIPTKITIEEIFDKDVNQNKKPEKLSIKITNNRDNHGKLIADSKQSENSVPPTPDEISRPLTPPSIAPSSSSSSSSQLLNFDVCLLTKQDLITDEHLNHNRLPQTEWSNYSVLKDYSPENATNRLFVKNIHRKVSLKELYQLFARYIDLGNEDHLKNFHIKHFTKGRLKGQAFVNYPMVEQARNALESTNGYCFYEKDKPIVVLYSRSSN